MRARGRVLRVSMPIIHRPNVAWRAPTRGTPQGGAGSGERELAQAAAGLRGPEVAHKVHRGALALGEPRVPRHHGRQRQLQAVDGVAHARDEPDELSVGHARARGPPLLDRLPLHPGGRLFERLLGQHVVHGAWDPAAQLALARIEDAARRAARRLNVPVAHGVVDVGALAVVQLEGHAPRGGVVGVLHEVLELHVQRVDLVRRLDRLRAVLLVVGVVGHAVDARHHLVVPLQVHDAPENDAVWRLDVLDHHHAPRVPVLSNHSLHHWLACAKPLLVPRRQQQLRRPNRVRRELAVVVVRLRLAGRLCGGDQQRATQAGQPHGAR
mmetsp:Transcript_37850/g.64871  ORF Transcript_37850/g.64871 Transcript_37850/m.64871 type:complete len:325 (+) Transcript_37850:318-1292(+)